MFSKFQDITTEVEKGYIDDTDLSFIDEYVQTYRLRLSAYDQVKESERQIIEQLQSRILASDPNIFKRGKEDLSTKWKQDTIRVLRHSAVAMLLNDTEMLREKFLLWFQTLMQAFGTQKICDITYRDMQTVVQQLLPKEVANLLCPILELNRSILGQAEPKT
ncbi:MAG: phycobilisome protein [Oscillatoriales cyanobacterium SM2_2_1]|nr:phycobilisome protein [Oscillatoriales cyanobacterium SM2_2_1]